MYGHERGTKNRCDDDDKLYAGMYALECEDTGRISESSQ